MSQYLECLRYDFRAIRTLSKAHKINLFLDGEAALDPEKIEKIVWAGNLHVDPGVKLKDVISGLGDLPPRDVVEAVSDAIRESMGEPEPDQAEDHGGDEGDGGDPPDSFATLDDEAQEQGDPDFATLED